MQNGKKAKWKRVSGLLIYSDWRTVPCKLLKEVARAAPQGGVFQEEGTLSVMTPGRAGDWCVDRQPRWLWHRERGQEWGWGKR